MKRKLEYITAPDGTRVPFDDFIEMSARAQAGLLRRGYHLSEAQRQRLRLANTKQRREVITPLGEFASMTEAAKAHGLWGSNGIKLRIQRGYPGYRYK